MRTPLATLEKIEGKKVLTSKTAEKNDECGEEAAAFLQKLAEDMLSGAVKEEDLKTEKERRAREASMGVPAARKKPAAAAKSASKKQTQEERCDAWFDEDSFYDDEEGDDD